MGEFLNLRHAKGQKVSSLLVECMHFYFRDHKIKHIRHGLMLQSNG